MKNVLEYFTNLWYAIINKKYSRECDNMNERNTCKINEELEQRAKSILISHEMLKLPVDLIKIADENNIDVYYKDLPKHISGAIKYDNTINRFKILINENEHKNRQRFTLAHELAHYFLTQQQLEATGEMYIDTLYRQYNIEEQEVDYLAGALLMDKDILTRAYNLVESISVLSKIFEVSETAMTVRLMKIGIL